MKSFFNYIWQSGLLFVLKYCSRLSSFKDWQDVSQDIVRQQSNHLYDLPTTIRVIASLSVYR